MTKAEKKNVDKSGVTEYVYCLITPGGKRKRGSIQAETGEAARRRLNNGGNVVISLEEAGILERQIRPLPGREEGRPREMEMFCRQFAALLNAGISVTQALSMLEQKTEKRVLRLALSKVRNSVENGNTLAESMKCCRTVFSPLLISMIKAGEESGRLEQSMERMAAYYEKVACLQAVVQKATIYPLILSAACLAVLCILLFFLIPMYEELFEMMEAELPAVTRFVVMGSHWMKENGGFLVLFLVFLTSAACLLRRTRWNGWMEKQVVLHLPWLGMLRRKLACARFAGSLGALLEAGVPLPEALELTAETMELQVFCQAVQRIRTLVEHGVSLTAALMAQEVFLPMLYSMAAAGEETGNLCTMLLSAADYYEKEAAFQTEKGAAALEPLLVLGMGLVVSLVLAAVFAPMLALYDGMQYL